MTNWSSRCPRSEVEAAIPVIRDVMENAAEPAVRLTRAAAGRCARRAQLGRGALTMDQDASNGPLLSFTLASLLIELTPGPNMTYLALVAAAEGRRAGFAAVAGVALGLAVIGLAAALGVAELVPALPARLRNAALGRHPLPALSRLGWLARRRRCARRTGEQVATRLFHARARHEPAQSQGGAVLCRGAADLPRSGAPVARPDARRCRRSMCRSRPSSMPASSRLQAH